MIEVENLSKHFGIFTAVDNINFSIKKGEIVGLLGPNGAGKTTSMRMMTGFYEPTSGTVSVNGMSITEHRQEIQRILGYLPESASSYSDMIVADYLSFIASARNLEGSELRNGIDRAVAATSLEKFYYRPISHLSKGFRQRVGLAATLVHDPEVLILDEPTSGLDPNQIKEIQDLIRKLAEEKTIILSTHILREVEETCRRAIIISQGRIVLDESLASLEKLKEGGLRILLSLKGSPQNAYDILEERFTAPNEHIERATSDENETRFTVTSGPEAPEKLFAIAVENNWIIRELTPERQSLNEIFHNLTGGRQS